MDIIRTNIEDVIGFVPKKFRDERGFFMESYRSSWFATANLEEPNFIQDNHSSSSKGILRGLHYQIEQPQGKLIRVTYGEVFDVAVDLRKQSKTYGQWTGMTLSAENQRVLWIPPGFAHGFLVLSERAESLYKCTEYYAPEFERTLLWNDPELNIEWPLQTIGQVMLSNKDRNGQTFKQADTYIDRL